MDDDPETVVGKWKDRVSAFSKAREWECFHTPKNLSMAIAAEAAELMEHFLWEDGSGKNGLPEDSGKRAEIEEELADILIFCTQFANVTGIDMSRAVAAKLEKNETRYPVEKARGRADKYNEL